MPESPAWLTAPLLDHHSCVHTRTINAIVLGVVALIVPIVVLMVVLIVVMMVMPSPPMPMPPSSLTARAAGDLGKGRGPVKVTTILTTVRSEPRAGYPQSIEMMARPERFELPTFWFVA